MLNKFFKKKIANSANNEVLIASLLVHAAKIDNNYTKLEKQIIKKALLNLNLVKQNDIEELLVKAEIKEKESNQIIEFTKEIKKNSIEFRLKIIEILWQIVYSDNTNDMFESNLIRRVCGLLYVSDKDSGEVKLKVKNATK